MACKLRIAWSVACGLLCLLLIALWVRSYYSSDQLLTYVSKSRCLSLGSVQGQLHVHLTHLRPWPFDRNSVLLKAPIDEWHKAEAKAGNTQPRVGTVSVAVDGFKLPYWLAVLMTGMMILPASICWRFSLRTLFIAATLVAVALGVIVLLN